jgi:hypothetical protein
MYAVAQTVPPPVTTPADDLEKTTDELKHEVETMRVNRRREHKLSTTEQRLVTRGRR